MLQPGAGPLAQLCRRRTSHEPVSPTENPVVNKPEDSDGAADEEPKKSVGADSSRSTAVLVHADQVASLRRWRILLGAISMLRT